jgi:zinc transporter ZupT
MPLWKRLWLLFTVIWVVVAGLNVATILALGDNPPAKAVGPAVLMIAVPTVGYLIVWLLFGRRGRKSGD